MFSSSNFGFVASLFGLKSVKVEMCGSVPGSGGVVYGGARVFAIGRSERSAMIRGRGRSQIDLALIWPDGVRSGNPGVQIPLQPSGSIDLIAAQPAIVLLRVAQFYLRRRK